MICIRNQTFNATNSVPFDLSGVETSDVKSKKILNAFYFLFLTEAASLAVYQPSLFTLHPLEPVMISRV